MIALRKDKVKHMNYKLVPMDKGHLDAVAALEQVCISPPWPRSMLEEELYNPNVSLVVAEGEDGSVLGYGEIGVVLDEGCLEKIAVDPKYRRQGIAGELLAVFHRFAEGNKMAFLTLEVRDSNASARALYTKHGFKEVGVRKNYYDHPKEDAIIMTLEF